jgi:hypothetical protein
VLAPATAYVYLAHPDWWWLYLLDPARVPRLFVIPTLAATAAALFGGYHGVGRMIAARTPGRQVLAVLGAGGAVSLLLVTLARDRLLHVGTYDGYHAGRAASLFQVKLGFVLVALAAGLCAAVGYVAWEIWRDGHRAHAR